MDFAQDDRRIPELEGRQHLYRHRGLPWQGDRSEIVEEGEGRFPAVHQGFG